jgi:hypothetical protein
MTSRASKLRHQAALASYRPHRTARECPVCGCYVEYRFRYTSHSRSGGPGICSASGKSHYRVLRALKLGRWPE